ncbi:hypothetical protein HV079_04250 [Citrobacter freundii]|uniref:hypothetical protein n=1 Tax=Citrobacter freundii TaxID=546 RepID=UPI0015E92964|nr:hypothetical protein [Citrobacter freundii]QLZ58409.1 hypothetical protein HV079_04250 [Citrobacter freundii]
MKKYKSILLSLLLPSYSMACNSTDRDYMQFKNTQLKLEREEVSDDLAYSTLKKISENIDIYCPDADKVVYDTRNKVYSYIQSGRKIKASNIYECDSISAKNKCINKYNTDWDWTSRIYPRSTLELIRPYLHSGESIYFRATFDDFTIKKVYFTHMYLGVEMFQKIELNKLKKIEPYISATIPLNIKGVNTHQNISDDKISNSWLVAIYKNKNGKSLKIIWYYSKLNIL